ncbi:MAG: glutathione S-transferase [Sterolibacterium sp.]|nr:glutathione S-transferase [Sterolibacterium sp.]
MKLLGTLTSPYVRKVRIVLAEKKIDCEFVLDSPWLEGSQITRYNPLGKVPVLILDDDSVLYDSRVIVEYLDKLSPNKRLLPASGRERIHIKRWEALADGIADAAADALLESRRPDGERSPSWMARQHGKVRAGLQALAAELGENLWCQGTALSLADIAVGCALGYVSFRHPDIDWRSEHASLARLYERLLQRPSFAQTVPQD